MGKIAERRGGSEGGRGGGGRGGVENWAERKSLD